jgi:hypothetical protein
MSLFKKAENTQAYAKVGFLGFAGAGKTYTATEFAIGLARLAKQLKLPIGEKPIFFLDTETGSDWVAPRIREAGIELMTAKTRAFADLMTAVREAEKEASALIIDSISHFWRELCDTYAKRKNRTRLEFQDWAVLKTQWGQFTDVFVNSNVHIILCGRAGYEYDFFEDADGRKQLEKTGIKMKAETEMGYEPSLLVLMERETDANDLTKVHRVAHILKDRSTRLDGKSFRNPTFDYFKPHVEFLNLGGTQLGVDTSRTSDELFTGDGDTRWQYERKQKLIALEEIEGEIVKLYPGQTAGDKRAKADLVEELFGTRSWTAVESMSLEKIQDARNRLWLKSRRHAYGAQPEAEPPQEAVNQ